MLLFHFADLHIGKRNPVHVRATFDAIGTLVKKELGGKSPSECPAMVVIAGDIFDHKTNIRGSEGLLFHHLLRMFRYADETPLPTIIIPGNHDLELGNVQTRDISLISIFEEMYRGQIHYSHDSGAFSVGGIPFYHFSVTDGRHKASVARTADHAALAATALTDQVRGRILLYHGFMDGMTMGTGRKYMTPLPESVQAAAIAVFAGDIHDYQQIGAHSFYSGSPMQQTFADVGEYGFIVHTLTTGPDVKLVESRFVPIPPIHHLQTINLTGQDRPEQLPAGPEHEGCLRIISNRKSDYDQYAGMRGVSMVYQIPQIEMNCANIHESIARLCPGLDDSVVQELALIFRGGKDAAPTPYAAGVRWSLLRMQWRNLFCYSGEWSRIDFTLLANVLSGVVAPNCAGKSAIIDIIGYVLFNVKMRGFGERIVRNGETTGDIVVEIEAAGSVWTVSRRISSDTKSDDVGLYSGRGVEKKLELRGAILVYEQLHRMIGGIGKTSMTAIMRSGTDLITATPAERANILAGLFQLPTSEELHDDLARRRAEHGRTVAATPPITAEMVEASFDQWTKAKAEQVARAEEWQRCLTELQSRIVPPMSRLPESYRAEMAGLEGRVRSAPPAPERNPVPLPATPRPRTAPTNLSRAKLQDAVTAAAALPGETQLSAQLLVIDRAGPGTSETDRVLRSQLVSAAAQLQSKIDQLGREGVEGDTSFTFGDECPHCIGNRETLRLVRVANAVPQINKLMGELNRARAQLSAMAPETAPPNPEVRAAIAEQLVLVQRGRRAQELMDAETGAALWAEYDQYLVYAEWVAVAAQYTELKRKYTAAVAAHDEWLRANAGVERLRERVAEARAASLFAARMEAARGEEYAQLDKKYTDYVGAQPQLVHGASIISAMEGLLKGGNLTKALFYGQLETVLAEASRILTQSHLHFTISLAQLAPAKSGVHSTSNIDFMRNRDGETIPLRFACGFEQFAASLAMRIAFTRALGNTADFIMIDEGFGCLDAVNMPRVISLLGEMAASYRFFFIISHIAELQSALEHTISITVGPGGSVIAGTGPIETEIKWPPYPAPPGTVWCECTPRDPIRATNKRHTETKRHHEWAAKK